VPVLVLSVLAAHERALASGANAFLRKPLEKESLLAALRGMTEPSGARPLPRVEAA